MAREYFCAYHSYLKSVELLNDAECGRLFRACLQYSMTGAVPELCGNERFVWPTIQQQIDRDKEKYGAFREKQAENGAKGGRPAKPKKPKPLSENPKNPSLFLETQKTQRKDKGKDKGKDEGKGEYKGKDEGQVYPPESPLPGGTAELQAAFAEWLQYKAERRQAYKPTGLKALQKQVLDAAKVYGDRAVIGLIRESMASNYQGLFFDRLGWQKKQHSDGLSELLEEVGL